MHDNNNTSAIESMKEAGVVPVTLARTEHKYKHLYLALLAVKSTIIPLQLVKQ